MFAGYKKVKICQDIQFLPHSSDKKKNSASCIYQATFQICLKVRGNIGNNSLYLDMAWK